MLLSGHARRLRLFRKPTAKTSEDKRIHREVPPRNNSASAAFSSVRDEDGSAAPGVIMADEAQTAQAFEAFIVPHLRMLWRLARRLVRESADADDLVQETCLKAFRSFHQFRPGSKATAWLVTILVNAYRDRARQASRIPLALSFDEMAEFLQQQPRHAARTPEAMAIQTDLGHLVRLAIDDLPPEFRLVVLLADVEGLTYQEIADTVGCPLGTVMSRLHRGRRLLHTTLRALIEE